MSYSAKAREFTQAHMQAAGTPLPAGPQNLPMAEKVFIATMVHDEMMELMEAETVVEQADALVDAIYYICNFAEKHGIDLDPIYDAVHDANMRKLVGGRVILREDGKVMKPDGWVGPEDAIRRAIVAQVAKANKQAQAAGKQPELF
jgi:predicted HAD superfamily Cof-like phosphohydrolase